ncbi:MAG: helix-turn-helix transcriptional regulator [Eubacterium sp.]|nr:helix-turn-helix transcriptional regulator [Eubacterium sp.]
MNYSFILYRITIDLYTAARMYDKEYTLIDMLRKDPDLDDNHVAAAIVEQPLIRENDGKMPLIFTINKDLIYAWVDSEKNYFLLGPTRFEELFIPHDRPGTGLKNDITLPDIDTAPILSLIPSCTIQILADHAATLYNLERNIKKDFLDAQDIIHANRIIPDATSMDTMEMLTQTIFDNVENSFAHNPYNHEKLEVNYVRNGDVESLSRLLKERFPGRYGKLSDDPIKQEIYLAIVAITLASRGAIDGGLHPETAFYLSDVSIYKIGNCRDANEIIRLTVEAELQYARLVRDLQESSDDDITPEENPHISRCKDYIFAHMHGKITVQELAAAVGLETNYLSTLFKRCEKKTIKQYINEEKVKLIKNLLTYSSYSYIEIATYLGFSSQSHMGMEFKRITGMTPGEYRAKYVREDFMNDSM